METVKCQIETVDCHNPVKYMLAQYVKRTYKGELVGIGVCGIHIVTGLKEIGDPRLAVIGRYEHSAYSDTSTS